MQSLLKIRLLRFGGLSRTVPRGSSLTFAWPATALSVVFHDETLLRLAGQFPVAELTAESSERSMWVIGSVKGLPLEGSEPFANIFQLWPAPSNFFQDSRRIFIELKCGDDDVQRLLRLFVRWLPARPCVVRIVKSFRLAVIPQVKMLLPDVKTAALFAPKIMNILERKNTGQYCRGIRGR